MGDISVVIRMNGDFDNNSIYPQGTSVDQQEDKKYLRDMRAAGVQKPDRFSKAGRKKKKEHFSVFRAGKEFVKGLFRPIGAMLKHPIMAIGSIVGLGILASVAPITIPIMTVIGFGMGINQALMGIIKASVNYHLGDYKDAEKAFGDIGEGSLTVAGASAAMKTAGAIAAEAKTATAALKGATTDEAKIAAVEKGLDEGIKVQQGTWRDAFKQTHSVMMNPRAVWSQLNPRTMFNTGLSKGRSFVTLFKSPEKVDMMAAYRTARTHLGMEENEAPTVEIAGTSEPHYNSRSNVLYLPENHPNYKLFSNYPRLQTLLDHSPKFVQNFAINLAAKRQIPTEKLIIHELVQARQTRQLEHLTKSEALDAMEGQFPFTSRSEKRDLLANYNIGRQEDLVTLTKQQAKDAQNLVNDIRKAHLAGADVDAATNVAEGNGILPNIAHPFSLDARKAANDFGKQQALDTLRKKHRYQAEGSKALRQLRKELAEARQNATIEEWRNEAAARGTSDPNVEAIETKMHATRHLFGTSNPTGNLLRADQQAKRAYALQQKLRRFSEESLGAHEDSFPLENEFGSHRQNYGPTEEEIADTIEELSKYPGAAEVTDDTLLPKKPTIPEQRGFVDDANPTPKPLQTQKKNPATGSGQPVESTSTTQQTPSPAKQEQATPHSGTVQPEAEPIRHRVTVEDVPEEEVSMRDSLTDSTVSVRQHASKNGVASMPATQPANSASQILDDQNVIPDTENEVDWTRVPRNANEASPEGVQSIGTDKSGNINADTQGRHQPSHSNKASNIDADLDNPEEFYFTSSASSTASDLGDLEDFGFPDDEAFKDLPTASNGHPYKAEPSSSITDEPNPNIPQGPTLNFPKATVEDNTFQKKTS